MAAHEQEFSLKRMSKVLGVSRSGYYAWKRRSPSLREQADEALLVDIRAAYQKSRKTYGSPRIHAYLRRKGHFCGWNRVARLMRQHQIVARKAYRHHPRTTQQHPGDRIAPNLLNREFSAAFPNQKWVSDITYIGTAEGWLYLAVVLDLYSRLVVGWAMGEQMDAGLVEGAWQMALLNREPAAGLLHHSDRGSQYTSEEYRDRLADLHCQVSMSRTGNCYDNAVVESFFATLKAECADIVFKSKAEACTAIFEFIEGWYNRQRLHSTLDYLSPVEFELSSGH
ncbi:MAG: IS3 family transposase [Anaerolineales bacterium]